MTSRMGSVRRAQLHEREAANALWDAAGLARIEADEWRMLVTGPVGTVLVAEMDGRVAGAAIAAFDGWRAYIYHVAVAEAFRERGIARELMSKAERHLADRGATNVYVMVDQGNTAGLALVGSTGYLPEGEIVLVKTIAQPALV